MFPILELQVSDVARIKLFTKKSEKLLCLSTQYSSLFSTASFKDGVVLYSLIRSESNEDLTLVGGD